MEDSGVAGYMEVTYERDGFHNYMLIQPVYPLLEFEIKMIHQHPECGLLKMRQEQGKLLYEMQGLKTFAHIFAEQTVDFSLIWNLLNSIVIILETVEDYLLRADSIILEPDKIYLNRQKEIVNLCYIPGYSGNIQKQFCSFMEYLMQHMNHRDDELVVLVYGIYHLIREGNYSLSGLEQMLMERKPSEKRKSESQNFITMNSSNKEIVSSHETDSTMKEANSQNRQKEVQIYLWQKQISKLKQKCILLAMAATVFLIGVIYFYEALFVLHSMTNGKWLYGSLAALLCGIGGLVFQSRRIKRIRKKCEKSV